MRDPAIHIRFSDFLKIYKSIDHTQDAEDIVDEFFIKALPYRLKGRQVLNLKKKSLEALKRVQKTDDEFIENFLVILYDERVVAQHKYIKTINKKSSEYVTAAEIAANAQEFIQLFNLGEDDGMRQYCRIGIKMMGKKYGLNKFKYYNARIFSEFEQALELKQDSNSKLTKEIYKYYKGKVGLSKIEFTSDFVYCRQVIEEEKANVSDFIDAQFEGLSVFGAVPEPYQLHTENSKARYRIFMNGKGANKSELDERYRKFINEGK